MTTELGWGGPGDLRSRCRGGRRPTRESTRSVSGSTPQVHLDSKGVFQLSSFQTGLVCLKLAIEVLVSGEVGRTEMVMVPQSRENSLFVLNGREVWSPRRGLLFELLQEGRQGDVVPFHKFVSAVPRRKCEED